MLDRDQILALVAREVALIEAPDRRAALEALLIEPRLEERTWDYAWPIVRYPYWVVAEESFHMSPEERFGRESRPDT